jgi:hypothetical protein
MIAATSRPPSVRIAVCPGAGHLSHRCAEWPPTSRLTPLLADVPDPRAGQPAVATCPRARDGQYVPYRIVVPPRIMTASRRSPHSAGPASSPRSVSPVLGRGRRSPHPACRPGRKSCFSSGSAPRAIAWTNQPARGRPQRHLSRREESSSPHHLAVITPPSISRPVAGAARSGPGLVGQLTASCHRS